MRIFVYYMNLKYVDDGFRLEFPSKVGAFEDFATLMMNVNPTMNKVMLFNYFAKLMDDICVEEDVVEQESLRPLASPSRKLAPVPTRSFVIPSFSCSVIVR